VSTLDIHSKRDGEEHRLVLAGELDIATVPELEQALAAIKDGVERVVVDLSGLRFMDSTGLRTILRANQRLEAEGEQLLLMRGPSAVQRVFETTGMAPRLRFYDGAAPARGD
jgi:anti-sigma B factor antagonist